MPFINVYVDSSEYEDYIKFNPKLEIIKCEEGVQGNVSRIRNYILKKEFDNGADAVVLVDDDLRGVYYWENKKAHLVETDAFINFIKKYSIVAKEWGAYLWGVNVNQDKQVYREYSPFSTLSFVGGPFQVFLKGNNCWYDERLFLKEDYDMTLQQINKNRIVLRLNKFFYSCRQSEQIGGCAVQRNYKKEEEQLKLLQSKWGKQIVKVDFNKRSHNLKKKKTRIDYNPIIKVPIAGI